jgi:pSer/pThr/pTyr-binding forkhead associated (FHA) protein
MPPNKRATGSPYPDDEILRADDPKPQRVPQYPTTGVRRAVKRIAEEAIPTSVFDTEKHDEELRASYRAADAFTPAFLYVERGPGQGQLMEVKQGAVVVGRASVADLRLQHPSISRRHAQVRRVGEQFWVKDLGSQNGTFVNKQRIAAEVEVRPGDLLAIGNALLKLRGPLQKNELPQIPVLQPKAQQPSRVARAAKPLQTSVVKRPRTTSNMAKIAIFGGAVGFGTAMVLAVALLKRESGPTFNALAEDAAALPSAVEAPEPEISSGDAVVKEQRIQDALTRKMQEKRAQANTAPAAVAAAVEPAPMVDEAPTAVTTRAASPGRPAVAVASRPVAKTAADDAEDDEANAVAPEIGKRAALLAAYEKGNATTSLEAAKKAGDKELISQLSAFLEAYEAAGNAVVAKQGSAAIRNFEKALKLDEDLSSGWSKYGGEIRMRLANLYTLVGLQHVANDNPDNAKLAFKAALKFDPTNAPAQGQLFKLTGEAVPAVGDDEQAPAAKKKAPPAKKSKAQAIDDAFGD